MGEYVVVDIETTGLSKYRHKITEIAAVKVKDGKIIGEFQELVNPQTPIPKFITRLTGIDDELVKDADPVQQVLPRFLDFIGNATMVAHNATFDHGFLSEHAAAHGITFCNPSVCTRKLATRMLPELPQRRLEHLCAFFDVENEQAHRALGDARATAQVFLKFMDLVTAKGMPHDALVELQCMPVQKAIRALSLCTSSTSS